MAVVAMSKFELTGLLCEQNEILDALQKTGALELTAKSGKAQETEPASGGNHELLSSQLSRVRKCIQAISDAGEKSKEAEEKSASKRAQNAIAREETQAESQTRISVQEKDFSDTLLITREEFFEIGKKSNELFRIVEKTEEEQKLLAERRAERNKINNLKSQLAVYECVPDAFSDFCDSNNTRCFFGTADGSKIDALSECLNGIPLVSCQIFSKDRQAVLCVVAHESSAERAAMELAEYSFSKCPFSDSVSAKQKIAELDKRCEVLSEEEERIGKETASHCARLKELKIYCDYLSYCVEKAAAEENFFKTQKTFSLKGYIPAEAFAQVKAALEEVTGAFVCNAYAPSDEDVPPTLLRNRGPAKAAEFVTNMYSVPDYREYDPNKFVFLFFMVFFGLIMADIGYGVLMLAGGSILLARLKVENGLKKLTRIIFYGGLFTIAFGALFGSCFGFSLYTFLPDPTSGSRTDVLTILLGCLALGLLQITVGYVLSAVNSFRKGAVLDAICDAFTWILFNIGLFFAVFNFLTGYFEIPVAAGIENFFSLMTLPGVIMAGAGVVGAMLTAGRKERFLGKFTKGFGALYGVINLLSDVLSYARLFGLMLSGMIIAQQFNGIGLDLIGAGGIGYVFGPLVMVIGHVFNIAMGVLGAYIHDCRLQYIEFFSKFYTGEGELFTPLGSQFQYVHFIR